MRRNELDLASQPVRNLITNPAMKTKSTGTDTVLINYAPNGSFEGATYTVGSMGGSPASWSTYTTATDKVHSGTKSFKQGTCTVAGQAGVKMYVNPLTTLKVVKGQRISWSFWIYSTVSGQLNPYWEGKKVSDGSYTGGGSPNGNVTIPANKWTYVTGTSGTFVQDSYVEGAGGYGLPVSVGDSVWWDEFCITQSDTPYPYFDGNTPAGDGYTYSWTGADNNSSSLRKAAASIVRTNLVANPSFKGGTMSTARTNLLTNPSFESSTGTNDVWYNNVLNPAFRGTTGTTNIRTNLVTNPSFETSTGTNDVWTNLVTNPSFEAAGSNINVRTNLVSNPSFESATASTTARTNLCINPRGVFAFSDYGTQTTTANVAITGHPEGLTTANRVSYTTGSNPGVFILSNPSVGTTYTMSAWVYHESTVTTPGSQGFAQSGITSMASPPTITTGVWQRFSWTYTATSTNPLGYRVSGQSGTGTGSYLITGVLVEVANSVLPFFDGSTSMSARINWASDPRATSTTVATNKLGWRNSRWFGGGSGAGTYTSVTGAGDGPNGITTYLRKTWTVSGTTNGDTGFEHGVTGTSGLPIMANTYYTASSYLRTNASGKSGVGMQIMYYDGAGTQVASSVGTTTTLTSGVWTRISHTALAPANAAYMMIFSDVDSGTLWAPGEYLDGTGLMVEQGGLANFFDGFNSAREGYTFGWRGTSNASISYATDGDYTYAWTGTANSSTSQLKITGATNIPANNTRTFAHQSSSWANKGTKSLRVTSFDSGSTDSFAILENDTGGMRLGMVAGKTYTISGTVRLVAEQTGTPSATRARRLVLFYNTTSNQVYQEVASNQASNAVGVERVKLTFTLPADTTEAFVRIYNGATSGDIWWDSIIVEEGVTAGEFFDGANPITNLCTNPDLEVNTTGWTAENGAVLTRDNYYIPGPGGWSGKVTGAGGDVYFTIPNVVKGDTYTFSVDYRGAATQTGTPNISLRDSSGTTTTTLLPLSQTTPKRFSVKHTATVSGNLVAYLFNGTGASDTFYFDNVLIENGSSSMYYTGNGDYTYAWTGTANNSPSAQQAPSAANVIGGNARTFQSGVWSKSGGKSVRLVPMDVSGSNATSAQVPVTLVAGKTYTVLATRFIEKPLTGTLNAAYGGKIALIQPGLSTLDSGTALPNTAGEGTIRWTFTVDPAATGQTLRIGHGGAANTGEVWWDKVLVVEGTYSGEYFDGTIPAFENLAKTAPSNLDGVNQTLTTGVSFAGQTWSRAAVVIGSGAPVIRQYAALSDLESGLTYTVSVTVANDQTFNQSFSLDFCDNGGTQFTILPGEVRRVKISTSKSVYDAVYRFADIQVNQSTTEARSLLFKDILIEKGTTAGDYYTGTGDFTYAWTGAVNASASVQRGTNMQNWVGATNAQIYQNSVVPVKYGAECAAVVTKGFSGDGIYLNDVTTTAGTSYTFSAWVKSAVALPRLDVVMRWKDGASAIVLDSQAEVSVGLAVGQWRRISMTAVAPANSVKIQPMLRIYASGYTPVTFYVDGAMLEATPVLMPYFDGAVPVSQNLAANPSLETNANNWFSYSGGSGSSTPTRQTSGGYSGSAFYRVTWTVSQTGANLGGSYFDAPGVIPGETYSASAKVRPSKNQKMKATIEWMNAGNRLVSSSPGLDTDLIGNQWGDLKVENVVAPAGAVTARVTLYSSALGTPWLANDTLDADCGLVELGPKVNAYYEGTGDFTYAWVGTAHASNSVQRATLVSGNQAGRSSGVGFVDSQHFTYQATDDTGKKIARWLSPAGTPDSSWRTININTASLNYASITAGTTYTLIMRYRSSGWGAGQTFRTAIKDSTSQNPVIGDDAPQALNTGWVDYRRTFVALINGLSTSTLYITMPQIPQAATDGTFDIAYWALVPGAYTGPYFDGSTTPTSVDFTNLWQGTVDASVSIVRGTMPSDISNANNGDNVARPINSTEWSASTGKSLRIIPAGSSTGTDTAINLHGSASSGFGSMVAGKTYTVKGTFRQTAPQTGTLHARARSIMIANSVDGWSNVVQAQAPNVAGSASLSATFTIPSAATWATVRLYNGASAGNGDVWWDDVVLVEGPYTGGYFDGDTTASGDFSYAWAGTANASQSYQKALSLPNWGIETKLTQYVTSSGTYMVLVKDPNGGGGRSFVPYSAPGTNLQLTEGKKYTVVVRGRKLDSSTLYRLAGTTTLNIPFTTSMSTQTLTFTASSNPLLYIDHPSGVNTAGAEYEYFGVFEEGDPLAYFDGDTSGTSGLYYRWKGAQWASQSEQVAPTVDGFVSEPNIRRWALPDGAMRVVNIAGSTTSLQTLQNTVVSGRMYTVLFRAKTYNSANVKLFGMSGLPLLTLTSNYAWYRASGVAIDTRFYLSTQGGISGAGFDISHMMVTEGTYTGAYLDGSSYGARWDGAAHASASLGFTPSLEALAGKPLYFTTANTNVGIPMSGSVASTDPRTIYTIVDNLADIPVGTSTIVTYGAASLDDTIDPNRTLIIREQFQDGSTYNAAVTRRTGGGGPTVADIPTKGRQILIGGLNDSSKLFSGYNFSSLAIDSITVEIPHEMLKIGLNTAYHSHVATYIFAGFHSDTVRAEVVKALALKHEVPIL